MRDQVSTYLFCGIVGFGIAMQINASFQIPQWETLVAGFLAVGAARMTMHAMFETDRRQQSRHDHVVRLTLRADIRSTEQGAYFANKLREAAVQIPDRPKYETAHTEGAEHLFASIDSMRWRFPENYRYIEQTQSWARQIKAFHRTISQTGVAELFPAPTKEAEKAVDAALARLEQRQKMLLEKLPASDPFPSEKFDSCEVAALELLKAANEFVEKLMELAAEYQRLNVSD